MILVEICLLETPQINVRKNYISPKQQILKKLAFYLKVSVLLLYIKWNSNKGIVWSFNRAIFFRLLGGLLVSYKPVGDNSNRNSVGRNFVSTSQFKQLSKLVNASLFGQFPALGNLGILNVEGTFNL